jgi:transcription antitermination factor NusG
MPERWYAARHHGASFLCAQTNLRYQQFEVFAPVYPATVIIRRRKVPVEKPVFSGYLFVLFDVDGARRWQVINSTLGVVHLLPLHSEDPQPLPPGFVEQLREQQFSVPALVDHINVFAKDELVRVLSGPFLSRVGRVVASTRTSTSIEIEAFAGRPTRLTVATADLAAVSGE